MPVLKAITIAPDKENWVLWEDRLVSEWELRLGNFHR